MAGNEGDVSDKSREGRKEIQVTVRRTSVSCK